jgi:hypothetical protein
MTLAFARSIGERTSIGRSGNEISASTTRGSMTLVDMRLAKIVSLGSIEDLVSAEILVIASLW